MEDNEPLVTVTEIEGIAQIEKWTGESLSCDINALLTAVIEASGITADDVVATVTANAHPDMRVSDIRELSKAVCRLFGVRD